MNEAMKDVITQSYELSDVLVYLRKLDVQVAFSCNLSCSGCVHGSPASRTKFIDVGEFERDLAILARHLRVLRFYLAGRRAVAASGVARAAEGGARQRPRAASRHPHERRGPRADAGRVLRRHRLHHRQPLPGRTPALHAGGDGRRSSSTRAASPAAIGARTRSRTAATTSVRAFRCSRNGCWRRGSASRAARATACLFATIRPSWPTWRATSTRRRRWRRAIGASVRTVRRSLTCCTSGGRPSWRQARSCNSGHPRTCLQARAANWRACWTRTSPRSRRANSTSPALPYPRGSQAEAPPPAANTGRCSDGPRSRSTRPPDSTTTRCAIAIVSLRCATMMRVSAI
jgi:hypothetical protein